MSKPRPEGPITVVIAWSRLTACSGMGHVEFLIRQELRAARIPIGPWGTSAPTHGVIAWHDTLTDRVISWRPGPAAEETKHLPKGTNP